LSLHNQKVGFMGQDKARQHLVDMGYAIVAENFRCRLGEIDLIATRGNVLVFLEVKTDLTGLYGEAESRVNVRKQRRIKRAALFFLAENKFRYHRNWEYRFDVIVVEGPVINMQKNQEIPWKPWYDSNNEEDFNREELNLRHIESAF